MSQPIQETGDSQTKNATPGGLDPSFLGMTQKIGGVAKNQVSDASVAKNQFFLRQVSQRMRQVSQKMRQVSPTPLKSNAFIV
jgi:hypothetical protein